MDVMEPQSISMLAARVALERLDTQDRKGNARGHRRARSLDRVARLIAARVAQLIASRHSPAGPEHRPTLGRGADG
jgi:hypothetical protein